MSAPVMIAERITVGLIGASPGESALRRALDEAERHGAAVTVVATGPASDAADRHVRELVARWAEKYPSVAVTLAVRRSVDAVITLAAASRQADLLVVERGPDPRAAATVAALTRRTHSDLLVVEAPPGPALR
ncbi:hypothetical protein [Actinoplanes sp. NPDC020271]|uniref:hypothetical protein n=1 Tax=Actinoplanes sp. NPDC020271 TaxID=3363896 RepID=UPI0037B8B9EC